MKHTCMLPKFCSQSSHIALAAAKTTLCTKFGAKITIFCVCHSPERIGDFNLYWAGVCTNDNLDVKTQGQVFIRATCSDAC